MVCFLKLDIEYLYILLNEKLFLLLIILFLILSIGYVIPPNDDNHNGKLYFLIHYNYIKNT